MGVTLRSTSFSEPANISDVLKYENGTYSREVVVIASGEGVLEIGTVLGKLTKGAASSEAKSGGNTGTGALTLDATTPVLANAKIGVYTVRCIATATGGGTFRVEDPDGYVLGDVAVGATFADGIKFVIADGDPDFIVGDGFDITVAEGSGKYVAHRDGAVTGSENAVAVLLQKVDATSDDQRAVICARMAEVSSLGLKWHSSVDTQNKKLAAHAQLAAAGIIVRTGA